MKKILLIYFVLGLIATVCNGQTKRIESHMMNCLYNAYPDKGTEFKKTMSEFEQVLIDNRILSDTTGRSYFALFKKIAKGINFKFDSSKSFSAMLMKITKPNYSQVMACQRQLLNNSNSKNGKISELSHVLDSLKSAKEFEPTNVAKGILSVLSEKDFELTYYKMKVLYLIDIFNSNNGINRQFINHDQTDRSFESNNPIYIYLNAKNEVIVNKKKVTLKQLKIIIRDYELKNKSESQIEFKIDKVAMYKTYTDVLKAIAEEIQILREQLSQEKYKTDFDKLTKKQAALIKKIYPERLKNQ